MKRQHKVGVAEEVFQAQGAGIDGIGLCAQNISQGLGQTGRLIAGGQAITRAGDLPDTAGDGALGVAGDGLGDLWQYGFIEFANVQDGRIVVGGGHAHVTGDGIVAAAAGGMGDVEGL